MNILTLTCWSHEIKFHLFSWNSPAVLASGTIERVDLGTSFLTLRVPGKEPVVREMEDNDHRHAVGLIIAILADAEHGVIAGPAGIAAVGHRVAHGGEEFRHSVRIDDDVLRTIGSLQHLAPLHCGPNIAGIEAARELLPGIPHVAVFDTAFHASMPEAAYLYPLPHEWYKKYGVRRYGFHGPSHLYLSRRASVLLEKPLDACNLITIHLDRGVSLCAIKDGRSVDTSMGMTPLEGAVMETRCGDIDPGIPAFVMQEMELSPQELEQTLNHKSGISGITGRRLERHDFLRAARDGDQRCRLALEMETYRVRKYIGAYVAAIGPLDGIVFTAGTGADEWPAREQVLGGLECFGIRYDRKENRSIRSRGEEADLTAEGSKVRIFVIPTNEELVMAEDVATVCTGNRVDSPSSYSFADGRFVPVAHAS
jgi:acetate kinase